MTGDEASDEADEDKRVLLRNEKMGVVGDWGSSEDVDECERCKGLPWVLLLPLSGRSCRSSSELELARFLLASTSCGNRRALSSRMINEC